MLTPTTWDPTKSAPNATFTNNNLTIGPWGENGCTAFTVDGVTSGKYYWEIETSLDSGWNGDAYVGISRDSGDGYNSNPGNKDGALVLRSSGIIRKNGESETTGLTDWDSGPASYIVGVALDADSKTIEFWVGGVSQGSYSWSDLSLSGPVYAVVGNGLRHSSLQDVTANFGQSTFTYSVPSGFESGFGSGGNFYERPDTASGMYNIVSTRGNIRGKASEGFIRPTIKQFFMSSPDFEEVESSTIQDTYFIAHNGNSTSPDKLTLYTGSTVYTGGYLPGYKTEGKWYIEFRSVSSDSIWAGVVNPDTMVENSESYKSPGCIFCISSTSYNINVMPDAEPNNRYYTGNGKGWAQGSYIQVCWDYSTYTLSTYVNGVFLDSFSHTVPSRSYLPKITFCIIGYPSGREAKLCPNEDSVVYPINGYTYFGEEE